MNSSTRMIPKNWVSFQHYKDRCPPWIKLHRGLLDDSSFQHLPIASRALAPMLWLLASESKDGSFDGSASELAFRLRQTEKEITAGLEPLISKGFFLVEQDASAPLADCGQVAVPEAEAEAEAEKRRDTSPAKLATCPVDDIVALYQSILPELPAVRMMDPGRIKGIQDRWNWVLTTKRPNGTQRASNAEEAKQWFTSYFELAKDNDFLMGRKERVNGHKNWKCDIDFLMTTRGVKHDIEKTEAAA